jgi:hypothetical protein
MLTAPMLTTDTTYTRISIVDSLLFGAAGVALSLIWRDVDHAVLFGSGGLFLGAVFGGTAHAFAIAEGHARAMLPRSIPEMQVAVPALNAIVEDGKGGGTFHRVQEWAVSDKQLHYVAEQLVDNGFVWSHSFVRPQSLALTGVPLSRAQYESLRRQWVAARLTECQNDRYICTLPGRAIARRFAE